MNRIKINGNFNGNIHQNNYFGFLSIGLAILGFGLMYRGCIQQEKPPEEPKKLDYFLTTHSRIVHNRTCTRYYGKTKGIYLSDPQGYKNCKYCGGASFRKQTPRTQTIKENTMR